MSKKSTIFGLFFAVLAGFFLLAQTSKANVAEHLVLSEIQLAGASASEDFVEIYNPTSLNISLDGYRLVKRTSTGTVDTGLVVFASTDQIPAYGYFLWCNSSLSASLTCDKNTSGTIANNNSVALRNGAENTGEIVDAVSFGSVTNTLGEGVSIDSPPPASGSAERKAKSNSDAISMSSGGADELIGNSEDSNNNSADFVIRNVSQPQNSLSPTEALEQTTPTPAESSLPTPEPTSTPENTPTPTALPTPTPTPLQTQTPIPTPEQTPSPTFSPTPTPVTPSATPTPGSTLKSPFIDLRPIFVKLRIKFFLLWRLNFDRWGF